MFFGTRRGYEKGESFRVLSFEQELIFFLASALTPVLYESFVVNYLGLHYKISIEFSILCTSFGNSEIFFGCQIFSL